MTRSALLVVGHGTRSAEGQAECDRLMNVIRTRRPALRAELAYLELCPPPITDVVARLVGDEVTDLTVVPLVLLAAGHAKGDVPAAIARERRDHPGMAIRYGRALGIHPNVMDALAQRVDAAVAPEQRADTAVVVVGRGTSDPDANGDLCKIARLLWEGRPWPLVEPAFVSLARPSVPEALDRVRALGARRVVVVAHFLFTGVLERRIRAQAAEWLADHPEMTLVSAGYLGPHPHLADLVLERYDEARRGGAIPNCDTCLYRVPLPGFADRVGAPQTLHVHPDDPGTHVHVHPAPGMAGHRGGNGHGA